MNRTEVNVTLKSTIYDRQLDVIFASRFFFSRHHRFIDNIKDNKLYLQESHFKEKMNK